MTDSVSGLPTAVPPAAETVKRSPLRLAAIAYAFAACWFFGWLTARFGWVAGGIVAAIAALPAWFAWRMSRRGRRVAVREYVYLAGLASIAIGGAAFVVEKWLDAELDRLVLFEREYDEFVRNVESLPEFADVEVSFTRRKGGRIYLKGEVQMKESHDRLIQMVEYGVPNARSGYYDGVTYHHTGFEERFGSPEADSDP